MTISAIRRWFSARNKPVASLSRSRRVRPLLDALEDRALPSATMLVNDNWGVQSDVDQSGTLTAGDIVVNNQDAGATTVTGTYGVNAFSSINAAIDASASGDTVKVLQGTYTEDVIVDQSIQLQGPNAAISAGSGIESALTTRNAEAVIDGGIMVTADNVTIAGLTIEGGANFVGESTGVYLASGASDATIVNNIITGSGSGRGILSAFNGENDNLVIRNNEISDWTTGVFNQSNANVEITGNFIHDNFAGIGNDFVEGATIEFNTISNNEEGIASFESTGLEVHSNNLLDNDMAIINYGGVAIDASGNYFGTTDAALIAALVDGDVDTSAPLSFQLSSQTRTFTDDAGNKVVIDPTSGKFQITLASGQVLSGTNAKVNKGGAIVINERIDGQQVHVNITPNGKMNVNVHAVGKAKAKA